MKIYELNLHLPTSIDESDKNAIWNKTKDLLKKSNSEIAEEVAFKQLELAYPIKKESHTFFASLYFKALPEGVLELKEYLDHEQKVLRYMIVIHREVPKKYVPRKRPDRKQKSTLKKDEIAEQKDKSDSEKKIASVKGSKEESKSEVKEIKAEQKTDIKKVETVKKTDEIKVRKKQKKEPKIKLEDIDKSLEKLLENEL